MDSFVLSVTAILPLRIQQGHSRIDPHMDRETAEMLAHRGAKPVEGGFIFTHDSQLTIVATAENGSDGSFCLDLSEEVYAVFFSSICCPILAIL